MCVCLQAVSVVEFSCAAHRLFSPAEVPAGSATASVWHARQASPHALKAVLVCHVLQAVSVVEFSGAAHRLLSPTEVSAGSAAASILREAAGSSQT